MLAALLIATVPAAAGEPDEAAGSASSSMFQRVRQTLRQLKPGGDIRLIGDWNSRHADLLPVPKELFVPSATSQPRLASQPRQELARPIPQAELHEETPIDEILPYFDYEPPQVAQQEQDCQTICPCPDGSDCRKPGGNRPCTCPEGSIAQPWVAETYQPRAFGETIFPWDASNVFSNPLYFEDKALERYGHTYCCLIQPFASVTRFSGQLALLPYQMTLKPPHERRYALGYYRPGEWVPKLFYQIPLNARAAAVQAGVMAGTHLIFP